MAVNSSLHILEYDETTPHEVRKIIYRGVWQGIRKIYNVKVENGYTTIIIKPGEDVKQRLLATEEKFIRQE
jgi:hypothetical protein